MEAAEAHKQVEEAMKKAVEHTSSEFISIRTGKASPALVEISTCPLLLMAV